MAYCRWAWDGSDVYVYATPEGTIICCCDVSHRPITDPPHQVPEDRPEAMIAHLAAHKRAGDFVPSYAIERLWQEIPGPNEPVEPEPEDFTALKKAIWDDEAEDESRQRER